MVSYCERRKLSSAPASPMRSPASRTYCKIMSARLGDSVAVQGNLDPLYLLAPRELLATRVDDVILRAGPRPGHIFNLGHGIIPETPPDAVRFVADRVHERTSKKL